MTVALLVLIVLHALLHLLGFLKAFQLAELPALSGQMLVPLSPRLVGLLWLLTSLVLLSAAALRAFRLEHWWTVALAGVVLSQALIVLQWQDAKAGTAANLLIAIAIAWLELHTRNQGG
jgi:hypothetical protein